MAQQYCKPNEKYLKTALFNICVFILFNQSGSFQLKTIYVASATSCKRSAKLNKLLPACLLACVLPLRLCPLQRLFLVPLPRAPLPWLLHNLCRFYATRGRPNHAHTKSTTRPPAELSSDTISRHSTCGKWQPERTMPQRKLFECHKCLRFKGPLTLALALATTLVPPSSSAGSAFAGSASAPSPPPPPSNLLQFQVGSYWN